MLSQDTENVSLDVAMLNLRGTLCLTFEDPFLDHLAGSRFSVTHKHRSLSGLQAREQRLLSKVRVESKK